LATGDWKQATSDWQFGIMQGEIIFHAIKALFLDHFISAILLTKHFLPVASCKLPDVFFCQNTSI